MDKIKREAYFTVEAALVFPVVISVLLMSIFLFIFVYDRCLMEQDMEKIAVWAAMQGIAEEDEIRTALQQKLNQLNREKYIGWKWEVCKVSLQGKKIVCEAGGSFQLPVEGWMLPGMDTVWKASIRIQADVICPVEYIRLQEGLYKWKKEE